MNKPCVIIAKHKADKTQHRLFVTEHDTLSNEISNAIVGTIEYLSTLVDKYSDTENEFKIFENYKLSIGEIYQDVLTQQQLGQYLEIKKDICTDTPLIDTYVVIKLVHKDMYVGMNSSFVTDKKLAMICNETDANTLLTAVTNNTIFELVQVPISSISVHQKFIIDSVYNLTSLNHPYHEIIRNAFLNERIACINAQLNNQSLAQSYCVIKLVYSNFYIGENCSLVLKIENANIFTILDANEIISKLDKPSHFEIIKINKDQFTNKQIQKAKSVYDLDNFNHHYELFSSRSKFINGISVHINNYTGGIPTKSINTQDNNQSCSNCKHSKKVYFDTPSLHRVEYRIECRYNPPTVLGQHFSTKYPAVIQNGNSEQFDLGTCSKYEEK